MANRNEKLHGAIKNIITKQGEGFIKYVHFVNTLSDTIFFDDMPAAKTSLRDILRSGYGSKLLELDNRAEQRHKAKSCTSMLVNVVMLRANAADCSQRRNITLKGLTAI